MRFVVMIFFGLFIFVNTDVYASGGGTSVNSGIYGVSSSWTRFKVLPLKSFSLESALPPLIKAKFQLRCNQQFVKTIREDVVDATTGEVFILLGAAVLEDSRSRCVGNFDVEVSGGNAFSGRLHQIKSLN